MWNCFRNVIFISRFLVCVSAARACGLTDEHVEPPRFAPLSPEDSLKQIVVPPGYRVELVASEPQIEEPVMCVWDGNGRMYVAEMRSYMQDVKGTGTKTTPNGRIKLLEDTNGDGHYDKVTTFADGLLLPRIVLPLDERVIVQETDDSSLWSFRDTKRAGVADEKMLLWKGAKLSNSVEHQDSALLWNLDNWLYTAQGGTRHRFTRGQWETEKIAGQFNQWGLGMDDTGTLFFSDNSTPGRGFQQPWLYWNLVGEKTNWHFKRPSLGGATTDDFQKVYPINSTGDRGEKPLESYTAACGISIYRGDALPDLNGDLFICEPCGHLVRRGKVTRTDGKITLSNPYDHAEFFASRDFYCRPVWTATGPDGCLYVVDMYRGIIQDRPWVGPEFEERIVKSGMDQVKMRGRIYRIVPENFKQGPKPRMLDETPAQLVSHLDHANGWWRDTAQKLIVLRGDKSVVPALREMAKSHANPLARLHALWTLEGLDAGDADLVFEKLHDADARVRCAAIRLSEPALKHGDAETLKQLVALASDADTTVLRQLILSLGFSKSPEAVATIEKIAEAHLTSDIIYLATMTALYKNETPLIKRMLDGSVFRTIADATVRTSAQHRWKAGIESWKGIAHSVRKLDAETVALVEQGYQTYQQLCVACHGEDGRGVQVPGSTSTLAPPLVGSKRVLGPKEVAARILLHGLTGPVEGKSYEANLMPPLGAVNDDAWIASVLTYVRQEWTNAASPIHPKDIAKIRAASKEREQPWTLDELKAFDLPMLVDRKLWKASASTYAKPENAIDGKRDGGHTSSWHGQNQPGCWFALDLGKPYTLTQLILDSFYEDRYPRAFMVQVSEDGKTWSPPIAEGKGEGVLSHVTFEPVVARHVKITETGTAIERWQMTEVYVYGAAAEQTAAKQ